MPAQLTHNATRGGEGRSESGTSADSVNADGVGSDLNDNLINDYPVFAWSAYNPHPGFYVGLRTTNGG